MTPAEKIKFVESEEPLDVDMAVYQVGNSSAKGRNNEGKLSKIIMKQIHNYCMI